MYRFKLPIVNSLWIALLTLAACSSTPPKAEIPTWIHQPTRIVDNGYIVYIGTGSGPNPESAQFKAEGMALEDIANECSFIPKGTRVEDRYVEKSEHDANAYVKVALEFQECDQASKASDPLDVKRLANASFTAQMKRYQDFNETGDVPPSTELTPIKPPTSLASAPARASGWSEETHFYVLRQYVAYQNEVVILSPPAAYQPGSAEAKAYATQVQGTQQKVQATAVANPQLKTAPQAWSSMPDRPKVARPQVLAAKPSSHGAPMTLPRKNGDHSGSEGHHGKSGKHSKKRRN